MKSVSKLLITLLAITLVLGIALPSVVSADGYWTYAGSVCTPQYVWVETPTYTCYQPVVCQPTCRKPDRCDCTRCKPCPSRRKPCLSKKLNLIRDKSLALLKDLKANVQDYGWKVVKAERDRWKSARYVLKIDLKNISNDATMTVYQIVKTADYCNYETLFVWSYDRSSSDYCPEQVIGDMCDLLRLLHN